MVSQLARGADSGWGNEENEKKKEVFLVSGLSVVTPPPVLLFAHPLGARSFVHGG